MRPRTRIIFGTIGLLLVAFLAAALFLRYQIRKSFPVTSGTIAVPGLEQPVLVVRDSYGVPIIDARTEHDLMFATGFVHAQDRLWQMDLQRRAGEGRLSELFGIRTLPFDRMFRIVGIRRTAEAIAASMKVESMNRLRWYADGVNAYMAKSKGLAPAEFDLLGYDPEPWTPIHSIMIGRLMAWELNLSWWVDLTYGMIADKVGLERLLDIVPGFPGNVPPAVPGNEWRRYAGLGGDYLHVAEEYADAFGSASILGGSNAWVVGPRRSSTGAVILANDTHLRLQLPSHWYEIGMQMPGLHVRGMSIAGVPTIVSGRNDSIAWGLTNIMADDADFYVEQIDSATGTTYLYAGQQRPVTFLTEEISVRGDSTTPLTIRMTHHGPVVTDIVTPATMAHASYVASMRWTGLEVDDQFSAFTQINRATGWEEFSTGVREFAVPGQNFVYGDVKGNIGYRAGVRLPIRAGRNSLLPLPGWDPATEWKGFVPFSQLPHRFNPPEGYIASANNKIVDDSYPYHISDLWEPSSRIQRLNEVLGTKGDVFSVKDFERLQNDAYSYYAKEIISFVFDAYRDSTDDFPGREHIFEYLKNWNFQFSKEDIATTIFQEFLMCLIRNTYADELGENLFHDWLLLSNIPIRVTERLLEEGTSPWFDDVTTPERENRDVIIRRSLRQAVDHLRNRFGNDTRVWRWGDLHSVTLRHPFGLRKPLDRIFNVGPFPLGGGTTTLISGEYSLNEPFTVTVGPSFRQIFDLSGSARIHSVLPSGQSGQVFNAHYADQTRLWVNGAYRISSFASPTPGGEEERLTLEPSR